MYSCIYWAGDPSWKRYDNCNNNNNNNSNNVSYEAVSLKYTYGQDH